MENSKTKIINGLKKLNEEVVQPEDLEQNIDDLVVTAKDSLDIDDEQAKDFVSGIVGEDSNTELNKLVGLVKNVLGGLTVDQLNDRLNVFLDENPNLPLRLKRYHLIEMLRALGGHSKLANIPALDKLKGLKQDILTQAIINATNGSAVPSIISKLETPKVKPLGEEISDLSDVNAAVHNAEEDWQMHLQDTVNRSLKSFGVPDMVRTAILAKMHRAYWAGYDEIRRKIGGDWSNLGEGKVNEAVQTEKVVQYHSDRSGEEPFIINGIKWKYVNAVYPNGKKDIGVYRYDHDMVYDYRWFMTDVVGDKTFANVGEVNQEVMNDMIKQYGSKEAAEKVYYATANKQGRDPESFEMKEYGDEDYERAGREVEYGINPEVGADEYEELRKLKDTLVNGDNEGQPTDLEEGNDPEKLRRDVSIVMQKLDMSSIAPYIKKIDNPIEQAEMIGQFAEKIGVPRNQLSRVISNLRVLSKTDGQPEQAVEGKMTKKKLIESVTGKKQNKVIKTVKVKDIK